ncbi:hypothetical protein RB195_016841 [Necator americanus]|uniref:G-protein coupled receptors family 1 profile domain-containing protein n=2 Tax=Necator americanus TaxID=51031 RepID=A0ABR1C2E7_NECAM
MISGHASSLIALTRHDRGMLEIPPGPSLHAPGVLIAIVLVDANSVAMLNHMYHLGYRCWLLTCATPLLVVGVSDNYYPPATSRMEDTVEDPNNNYNWPYRQWFFAFNLVIGSIVVILNALIIFVILRSRSLRKMVGYRFMVHLCAVDLINSVTQIIAQACTFNNADMNYMINEINGAIFQGTWAADYPMILIVAVNRLIAVLLPFKTEIFFRADYTKAYIAACLLFGAMNTGVCLSGQVACIWLVEIPSFGFTESTTILANIINFVDFWFGEFIVLSSCACYIIIVFHLVRKTKRLDPLCKTQTVALPGETLASTDRTADMSKGPIAPPASSSALFYQLLQTMIVIRFGIPPLAALIVNRSIRIRFLQVLQGKNQLISTTTIAQPAATIRNGAHCKNTVTAATTTLFTTKEARIVNVKY